MKKEKSLAITYYTKQSVICPICKKPFPREELLSGGGRLIAGGLTDELRRTYEPSSKYGTVYPLIYSVAVCSNCNTAMLWNDMTSFNDSKTADILLDTAPERIETVKNIFPHYDFKRDRTLLEGCAGYYLALLCYEKMPAQYSPTIKKAQICLRLAWMCDDMNKLYPDKNYDFIRDSFYKKALFLYQEALNLEMEHRENITNISSFGPDLDKNYGYDGVIYLSCLLEYKYGQQKDINARLKKLETCKHSIARIFGLGKSSKAKPGPLLEHSRALYDNLTAVLKDAQNIDFSESSDDFEINQEDLSNLDSFSSDTNDLSLDNLSLDDLPDFSMDDF
ncbi:MAG: DUF2225 domain-containing protein [Spirochaetaceae bacterium]|nr:DUF2225 domain-containing protein [Spirochaetaceae bacterium]